MTDSTMTQPNDLPSDNDSVNHNEAPVGEFERYLQSVSLRAVRLDMSPIDNCVLGTAKGIEGYESSLAAAVVPERRSTNWPVAVGFWTLGLATGLLLAALGGSWFNGDSDTEILAEVVRLRHAQRVAEQRQLVQGSKKLGVSDDYLASDSPTYEGSNAGDGTGELDPQIESSSSVATVHEGVESMGLRPRTDYVSAFALSRPDDAGQLRHASRGLFVRYSLPNSDTAFRGSSVNESALIGPSGSTAGAPGIRAISSLGVLRDQMLDVAQPLY